MNKKSVDGKKYIHFAIIKLRTGGGLAKNGSYVKNYESLGCVRCVTNNVAFKIHIAVSYMDKLMSVFQNTML